VSDAPESKPDAVNKAFGRELTRVRKARGWDREQVVALMASDVGPRTLASWEHGTRAMTVQKFLEVCAAMGVSAPAILQIAAQKVELPDVEPDQEDIRVDLHAIIQATEIDDPMRRWANGRLKSDPNAPTALADRQTINDMAAFMDITPTTVLTRLRPFATQQLPWTPCPTCGGFLAIG
jgi:transcriptional regulator with XRE-family HTH domain